MASEYGHGPEVAATLAAWAARSHALLAAQAAREHTTRATPARTQGRALELVPDVRDQDAPDPVCA